MRIDATGIYYKDLNDDIHAAIAKGETEFTLDKVKGQRYIGVGLESPVSITINGVGGNDLGAFMNGATVVVNGNAQDGLGNTLNGGKIVVKGDAGDILGYAMRGGRVYIKGNVGYRTGIHMKAFEDRFPVLVVGEGSGDYLGEYMAGGYLVVLNLNDLDNPVGNYVGTGMHGGAIFIRGKVEAWQVGKEVGFQEVSSEEWAYLEPIINEFFADTETEPRQFEASEFIKLYPKSARPYGNLYSY